MTATVVAGPTEAPTIALTLYLSLRADVSDPADAVREVMQRLGTLSELTVVAPVAVPTAGGIQVDTRARTVAVDTVEVPLRRREFDLLLYLTRHRGRVFTRGQLLAAVWDDGFAGLRTVDVHVLRLRQKLDVGRAVIDTVRGVGYRMPAHAPVTLVAVADDAGGSGAVH